MNDSNLSMEASTKIDGMDVSTFLKDNKINDKEYSTKIREFIKFFKYVLYKSKYHRKFTES